MDALSRIPARLLPAAGLFFFSWIFFLWGAGPSIYGGDAGELTASAASLGVSHAPGYPLHALLGKAFTQATVWGNTAYKVNLLSALLSAGTVAGLFWLLQRGSPGVLVPLFGAVVYAAFPLVQEQARTTEAFALNNAVALGLMALLWPGEPRVSPAAGENAPARRRGLLWAFLYGVGLANHHTLVLLAPGFLAQGIGSCREPGLSPLQNLTKAARLLGRRLPAWSLFFLLGFSLYLYLPLRAAQHPPVNFGDPHTGPRFWNVLTRKEFGRLDLHPAAVPFRTQDLLWRQTNTFFRQNVHVLGGLALVLGLWGLVLSRRLSWLLFWLFSGPLFYVYSNLSPFNSLAQWRLERFLLLPSLMLPVGVAAFLGKWRTKKAKALAAILAIGLLAEPFILAGRPWHRWNLAFQDFGRNLTASLAPQSTLLIDRVLFDEPTSCLLHRLAVERQRPDLRVVYRPGTLFGLFYGEDLLELSWDKRLERQAQQERPLWDQSGPLAALAFVRENLPPFPFQLNGLLYHRGASPVPLPPFYIRRDREAGFPRDYPTALILIHYAYFQAKTAFEAKDFEGMRRWAGYASQRGGNMEWLQSNVGSLWSQWARAQESKEAGDSSVLAEAAFRRAVLLDPFFAPGQYGLGYARLQEKRYEEAARCFAEAARLRPEWAEAYYMLGLTFVVAGTPDRAREPWERFLQMDAGSPLAQDVRETLRRK